jgi:protocatechuate 3,4-dioxygenase alpha subunit
MRKETPSQTAGPYVHIGCTPNAAGLAGVYLKDPGAALPASAEGTKIRIEGKIRDGQGEVVRDALIELWQMDGNGNKGIWLRQATDLSTGLYQFDTVKPTAQDGAPHACLWITARGINLGLHTRVYFPDEDNQNDPVMRSAGHRAKTLIADRPDEEEDERDAGFPVYRFDIILQGNDETVFLDI